MSMGWLSNSKTVPSISSWSWNVYFFGSSDLFGFCETLLLLVCNAICDKISKYFPVSTKFCTDIPRCKTLGCFFFPKFQTSPFLLTFWFLWDFVIFLWKLYQVKNKFLWCPLGIWATLKLFHRAIYEVKMYILELIEYAFMFIHYSNTYEHIR